MPYWVTMFRARAVARWISLAAPGGLDAEHHLLGSTSAHQSTQFRAQFFSSGQILFFLGHLHGIAQRAGGVGNNGDLGHGLGMLFQRRHQCVTHLVIGDQPLFHVCQNGVLLLRTGQ